MDWRALWSLPDRPDDGPTPWHWLALLTALAAVLRIPGMNDGLWLDEIITLVESVRFPLSRIVTVFPGDNQHTFFSVLARLSVVAFGEHPWSLRLPAVLFGIATVPLLYGCAREFVGRAEAALSSLLLATVYHHVWFSQNARAYSMLAFLSVLSTWLLLRGVRHNRTSDWMWYGVAAALGIYAHLTMVFSLASHAVLVAGHLLYARGERPARPWRLPVAGVALAGVLAGLLYAPVVLDVRESVADSPAPVVGATAGWAAAEMLRGLRIGLGSAVGVIAGGAVFVTGLVSYLRQSPWLVALFFSPGLLTGAAAVVLQRPVRPRFFFFLIAFALLIVVRGALDIGRWLGRERARADARVRPLGVAIVAVLALLSATAVVLEARYPKQDYEGAMRHIDRENRSGDPVVVAGGARYPYQLYYMRDWAAIRTADDLAAARAGGRQVWIAFTLRSYIAADVLRTLDTECTATRVFRGTLTGGDVTVCVLPPVARETAVPREAPARAGAVSRAVPAGRVAGPA